MTILFWWQLVYLLFRCTLFFSDTEVDLQCHILHRSLVYYILLKSDPTQLFLWSHLWTFVWLDNLHPSWLSLELFLLTILIIPYDFHILILLQFSEHCNHFLNNNLLLFEFPLPNKLYESFFLFLFRIVLFVCFLYHPINVCTSF